MFRNLRITVVAAASIFAGGTALLVGSPAQASTEAPTLSKAVAYARDGAIYTSKGAGEQKLTASDGNGRPRWSTDGRTIAYLHAGELWQMNADGTAQHRVTEGKAGGPSFSPDGQWIAYSAPACLGGPGVYRVKAAAPHGVPEVLFPAACRDQALPAPTPADPAAQTATLVDRLRVDDAVAWSPDGKRIAFREGDCVSVFDDCLSIGNIETGMERTMAGFGGGGSEDGFAVVPAYRPDGAKVAWTTFDGTAVTITEAAADGSGRRQIGTSNDRELAYVDADRALVTAKHQGRSWVTLVDLNTGARVPFQAGSQPSVQP